MEMLWWWMSSLQWSEWGLVLVYSAAIFFFLVFVSFFPSWLFLSACFVGEISLLGDAVVAPLI